DVLRTLRPARPDPGTRGIAGREEAHPSGRGHAADAYAAVRGAADRGGARGRRAHVPAGAGAGADRRAPAARVGGAMSTLATRPWLDRDVLLRAILDSLRKLDPRHQLRNPVMFTVFVGSVFTTALGVQALFVRSEEPAGFTWVIAVWLWFTLLFANFAEAI